jgi:hypothetical protein
MVHPHWSSPGHNRTLASVCWTRTALLGSLAHVLLVLVGSSTRDAAQAAVGHGVALTGQVTARPPRVPALVSLVLHPCQQAAAHLPGTWAP